MDTGGSKASSSEETVWEESEVGDCFPRRLLRLATDLVDSLGDFFGRGLLSVGGDGTEDDEPLAGEGPFDDDCCVQKVT